MLSTETITELNALKAWIDARFARPPTSPSAKEYRKGFQDALLDLRIEIKRRIEEGLKS